MSNQLKSLFLAFCLVFFVSFVGNAQSSTATLSGVVEDQNSAVVPGASVTIQNRATSIERTVTTNDSGQFTIPLLQPGGYSVFVRKEGFTVVELRDIVLNVGDQKSVTVQLRVGDVNASTVDVQADASLVRTDASVGTVLTRDQFENIPQGGRSFQNLFDLTPGIVVVAGNAGGGQINSSGQRQTTVSMSVDGAGANFGIGAASTPGLTGSGRSVGYSAQGTTVSLVSLDALQEAKIQTSSFAPEFGRTPGAQISLISRSGENRFHGTMFESFRDDSMDASDWFVKANRLVDPPLSHHQFGMTLSGPILFPRFGDAGKDWLWRGTDKLFFFFSYEGLRLRLPRAQVDFVPSIDRRNSADPVIRPFLNALPIPNGRIVGDGTAEFAASWSNESRSDATAIRVDYFLNPSNRFFARYNDVPSFNRVRAALNTINVISQNTRSFTTGLTSILAKSLVNDVRLNYARVDAPSRPEIDSFGGAVPLGSDPFGTGSSSEDTVYSVQFTSPTAGSLRWGTVGDLKNRHFNVVDTVSYTAGDHTLKFGVDYLRLNPQYRGTAGLRTESLTFTTSDVSNARARSFLSTRSPQTALSVAYQSLSLFGQDTWRATDRLSFTYGTRWELVPPPRSTEGEDPITLANLDNIFGGEVRVLPAGRPLWRTRYGNFAPRAGASYMISRKTGQELVVRGGFGLFYDLGGGNASSVFFQYPYTASRSCPNGVGCPAGTTVAFPLVQAVIQPPQFGERPTTLNAPDPKLRLPLTYQWNVALERSFGAHQKISVTFVGSKTNHLIKQERYRIFLLDWPAVPPPAASTAVLINYFGNAGYSDYRSLQIQYQRRLHRNFSGLVHYTLARSQDTASDDGDITLNERRVATGLDFGYSSFDIRHNLTGTFTFEVPQIKGNWLFRSLVNGWGIDAIFRLRSGAPATVLTNGAFNDPSFPVNETFNVRPNVVPGQPFFVDDPTAPGGRRVNRAAFNHVVAANSIGDLPRGAVRDFPLRQLDLSVRREFQLFENLRFQLRAEVFNVTNTPNFTLGTVAVLANQDPAVFGRAVRMANQNLGGVGLSPLYSTGGPRSVQLSAKLIF